MNEMVERVARAIFKSQRGFDAAPSFWSHLPGGSDDVYRGMARAAIAEMRVPTDAMCEAAMMTLVLENKGIEYGPYQGWQAMIDTALKD